MLAGNVTASLVDGDLIVTGDRLDNSVEIAIVSGDLVVRGFDDTTINGAVTPFVAVAGSATIADDLFVRLGSGDDVLILNDGIEVTDRALISLSNGNDEFGASNITVGTDLNIFAWRGDDTIHLDNIDVGDDLLIHSTTGDDTINVLNSDISDDVRVTTGKGNDAVIIDTSTIGDDVDVRLGRDNDDLVVRNSTIGDNLIARTRKGDDFVMVDPSRIGGQANIGLGKGHDSFVDQGANEYGSLIVRGGRGTDGVDIDSASTTSGLQRVVKSESRTVRDSTIDTRLNGTTGALTRSAAATTLFAAFFPDSTPENVAPTTTGIDDIDVDEGAADSIVSLFDAFDDAEDADAALTYTIENNTNASLFTATTIDALAGTLTLDYATSGSGTANLTVRATDTGGLFVDTTFRVTITALPPPNTRPTTSGIGDIVVEEDAADSVISLFAAFDDAQDDDADLTYTIPNNTNAGLFDATTIDPVAGTLTLDYTPDGSGTANVTVRATDTGGLFVDTTFAVTVNALPPPNTQPTTSGIGNIVVEENSANSVIDLFAAFADQEDADSALTYSIETIANGVLFSTTLIDGAAGTLTLDYAPGVSGTASIEVRATDSGDLFVETTFMVTVNGPAELTLRLLPLFGGAIESNDTFITNDATYLLRGSRPPMQRLTSIAMVTVNSTTEQQRRNQMVTFSSKCRCYTTTTIAVPTRCRSGPATVWGNPFRSKSISTCRWEPLYGLIVRKGPLMLNCWTRMLR